MNQVISNQEDTNLERPERPSQISRFAQDSDGRSNSIKNQRSAELLSKPSKKTMALKMRKLVDNNQLQQTKNNLRSAEAVNESELVNKIHE